jgi:glucose-6-phosphate 1-epimerase
VMETGAGRLPRARVQGARAEAEVSLQGPPLTRWEPRGTAPAPCSPSHVIYAAGQAIRGGLPVVFPLVRPAHHRPGGAHARLRALAHVAAGEPPGERHVMMATLRVEAVA